MDIISTSRGGIGFLSLPAELRNQVYQYVSLEHSAVRGEILPLESDRNRDFRLHTVKSSISPRVPAIMQVSRQLRQEYSAYDKTTRSLGCATYDEFERRFRTIGTSAGKLDELYLQTNIEVKVWTHWVLASGNWKWRSEPRAAVLRVRYNSIEDEESNNSHSPLLYRIWFDVWGLDAEQLSLTPMSAERVRKNLIQHLHLVKKFELQTFLDMVDQLRKDESIEFWIANGDNGQGMLDYKKTNAFSMTIDSLEERKIGATQYSASSRCAPDSPCCICKNLRFYPY